MLKAILAALALLVLAPVAAAQNVPPPLPPQPYFEQPCLGDYHPQAFLNVCIYPRNFATPVLYMQCVHPVGDLEPPILDCWVVPIVDLDDGPTIPLPLEIQVYVLCNQESAGIECGCLFSNAYLGERFLVVVCSPVTNP